MEIDLSPDQQAFIRDAIDAGRVRHTADAVREALLLWEARERRRWEILAAVDRAELSFAAGEGREITEESMRALAKAVKQGGRTRLANEPSTTR